MHIWIYVCLNVYLQTLKYILCTYKYICIHDFVKTKYIKNICILNVPPKSSKDLYGIWSDGQHVQNLRPRRVFSLPSDKLARSECHHDNCTNHSEYDQKHAHPQERKCVPRSLYRPGKKKQHQIGTNPQWNSKNFLQWLMFHCHGGTT